MLIGGPVATGLAGAVVGGFLGALGGWGVHEDHVRDYESQVRAGKLLVVAHGNPQQVAVAQDALQHTPSEGLQLHAPTSADAPEVDDT
jgi:hypothetical protein